MPIRSISMRRALLDINIILDYYDNFRRDLFPESVELFELAKTRAKEGLFFISSASLDNIAFLKHKDLRESYPNLTYIQRKKIINKLLKELLSVFNICKTPSYIDINEDSDIEDELLISSAKAYGLTLITRDEIILNKYPHLAMHPKAYLEEYKKSVKTKRIPILDLKAQTFFLYSDIEKAIDEVIKKCNFILGEEVRFFEQDLKKYTETKHAIGVASGTDALLLSLRALAIKRRREEYWSKEDLIITTPFTFTATGDTILRSGATPLFVDINLETFNIDPAKIKEAVRAYKGKIVGIVSVHLYGLPCNMDEIMDIARENNLFVVEDCAQAFGAMYKGKKVGSFGDAGAFSFFPSKNLGAFGDAGAITTNDDELAEIITMLRVHGGKDKYNVEHIGYKARLDTLQAAVLLAKFKYIDEFNERRRKIAEAYNKELANIKSLVLPIAPMDSYHVYHQYTIRVENGKRDELQRYLKEKDIITMVYYPVPLHQMKVFEGRCKISGTLKNAEEACQSVLSLPVEPLFKENEIESVIWRLKEFLKQ